MGFLNSANPIELSYVKWMYLSGFVFCMILIAVLIVLMYINKTLSNDERVLRSVLLLTFVYIVANSSLGYLDYFGATVNYFIIYATYVIFSTVRVSLAFRMAYYFKRHMELNDRYIIVMFRVIGSIALATLLACAALFKNDFFLSRVDGRLVYGPGEIAIKIIAYSLIIYIMLRTLYMLSKPSFYTRRDDMVVVVRCFALALPFLVTQCIWPRIPAAYFGITLACVLVYISSLRGLISKDPLTDLENTKQLYIEMDRLARNSAVWSIIIIDIDHFSDINDEHGYDEGDMALVILTGILKNATKNRDARVFRYSRDIFAITCNHKVARAESAEISQICSHIKMGIKEYNDFAGRGYNIDISIGFTSNLKEDSIPAMLKRAEEMVQNEKYRKYDYLNVEDEDDTYEYDDEY